MYTDDTDTFPLPVQNVTYTHSQLSDCSRKAVKKTKSKTFKGYVKKNIYGHNTVKLVRVIKK